MNNLLNINLPEIKMCIEELLKDRTTNKNIVWGTNDYVKYGNQYKDEKEMNIDDIQNLTEEPLKPRVLKRIEVKKQRSKDKAEVFTPSWICNKMNNLVDEQIFKKKNTFNQEDDKNKTWIRNNNKIDFSSTEGLTWQQYVNLKQLEITCGEAPYLVSRYDTTSGNLIEVDNRIGLLDRKIRVINENVNDEEEWYKRIVEAYKSIYGYEYQGDNLFIARINLFMTFIEYTEYKWNKKPSITQLKEIANIISWNIWQMDGLKDIIPFIKDNGNEIYAKIKDWDNNEVFEFRNMKNT